GIEMTQVVRVLRHLRLIGITDKQRGGTGQQGHGNDGVLMGNLARQVQQVAHPGLQVVPEDSRIVNSLKKFVSLHKYLKTMAFKEETVYVFTWV
ncbi:MAG: hypothetical protein ACO21S_06275, partial [Sediminibacterium sp.]